MIRPGPPSVDPGQCPGGVVVHVYAVPSGRLITSSVATAGNVAEVAEADAAVFGQTLEALAGGAACLVAYDGDTGERYPPEAWV